MVASNFQTALRHVLQYEGGFANDPQDPGGRTLEGVTQRVYDAYRERHGRARRLLTADMRGDAEWVAERNEIYRQQYWDAARCDELPAGIDVVVFDGAVNSGVSRSVKWLQSALGVNADGSVGNVTLNMATESPDPDDVVEAICTRRLAFLKALKTWPRFGKGWAARVAATRMLGQTLARGRAATATVTAPLTAAHGKAAGERASIDDARSAPSPAPAGAAVGAGVATGGAAVVVDSAKDALLPLADGSDLVKYLVTGLVIVSAALTVGGLLWTWWAKHRAAKLKDALA